jgi:hypothetical protein
VTYLTALARVLVFGAALSFFAGFILNVLLGVGLTRSLFAVVWVFAAVGAAALVLRPGRASRPDPGGSSTTKPKPTPD